MIPDDPTRRHPHPFDRAVHQARNAVERTIGRLKDWRRVHTRHDKLATNFASAVPLAILTRWC